MATTRKSKILSKILYRVPQDIRWAVETITKDLAENYDWIARTLFPKAERIDDKFHVIKLVGEALQAIRVRYRQEALTEERKRREIYNEEIAKMRNEAKKNKQQFKTKDFPFPPQKHYKNDETKRELLARSR